MTTPRDIASQDFVRKVISDNPSITELGKKTAKDTFEIGYMNGTLEAMKLLQKEGFPESANLLRNLLRFVLGTELGEQK